MPLFILTIGLTVWMFQQLDSLTMMPGATAMPGMTMQPTCWNKFYRVARDMFWADARVSPKCFVRSDEHPLQRHVTPPSAIDMPTGMSQDRQNDNRPRSAGPRSARNAATTTAPQQNTKSGLCAIAWMDIEIACVAVTGRSSTSGNEMQKIARAKTANIGTRRTSLNHHRPPGLRGKHADQEGGIRRRAELPSVVA